MKNGLKPSTEDKRDFKMGAYYTLPSLSELPLSFSFPTLKVKDQGETFMCAAFAASTLSELEEGVELSPEYIYAKAKQINGDYTDDGLELRDVCKALVKYGSLEQKEAPFSLQTHPGAFLADWRNWPTELDQKAICHKKGSYWQVVGPYDHYDNIRAAIWKFRAKKQGVLFGVDWNWNVSDPLIQSVPSSGSGHALPEIGWNEKGEDIQNSYGTNIGDKGHFYFSRAVINHFVEKYGAFMFFDITPEEAQYYLQNGIKDTDNWLLGLLKVGLNLLKDILTKINAQSLGSFAKSFSSFIKPHSVSQDFTHQGD
jgi:C1A family cysteine protease